jgi:hypothetical protein
MTVETILGEEHSFTSEAAMKHSKQFVSFTGYTATITILKVSDTHTVFLPSDPVGMEGKFSALL